MVEPDASPVYLVREVHNYGGFFGGDTVSLTASLLNAPGEAVELTIADNVWANLTDRYKVVEGLALRLDLDGGEVRRAEVVGGRERAALRAAAQATHTPADQPIRPLTYHCRTCNLWLAGAPGGSGPYTCRVCGSTL